MNKTVMITGGSRGIGAECVKLFAENGYNVIFNYSNSDDKANMLSSSLNKSGYSVTAMKTDISDYEQVKKLADYVLTTYGKIDVLINNAGYSEQKLFTDITPQNWKKMIDINLNGVYNATHCFVKNMIHNKSGVIINVSSVWGISGASCEVHYSASKAGVIGFTKALAKELSLSGIRVNAVAPGIIDTDMNLHLTGEELNTFIEQLPLNRIGKPCEVAELIYYLASDKASYITGQTISIDGGLNI